MRPASAGRPVALIVSALALTSFLASCASSSDDEQAMPSSTGAASDPMPSSNTAGARDSGLDITSACVLLDVSSVELAVDGLGWGVVIDEAATCVYESADGSQRVTLTLFDLAQYERVAAGASAVSVGAAGMLAFPSDDGTAGVWTPVGAAGALAVSQEPPVIGEDALVALADEAALAYENAPLLGEADPSAAEGASGEVEGLLSVSVTGTVPSTGSTIGITVTAQKVIEVGAPAFTSIACVGGVGDDPAMGAGSYAVLAMDGTVVDGLTLAQLEATERVDGPGTYGASLQLNEADGDSFSLTGTMTIDGSMASGVYDVEDPSGAVVTGAWECVAAG